MKKIFIIIALILLIIISICIAEISINNKKILVQKQQNKEYEQYMNKDIYGTDVITLINKAIDNNKKMNVSQDKDGLYIDNGKDSILIKINLAGTDKTIEMEKIFALGTGRFIDLYNSEIFISEDVTYHEETGRIATITFKQLEN